ncbi:hypothetical protein HPB51_009365 [Rhipicephalus microplus]|uniref:Kinesin-like protein n=1 Tax=Rhipicephalus microplus TaxID=6941 RepID=A0A9J6F121_RHIMP|nr:hypothetical protein HPB51_009365 [Rhipicephalus microplus]
MRDINNKNIIVRFCSRDMRTEFLKKARKFRPKTELLGFSAAQKKPIYVNEHLTSDSRKNRQVRSHDMNEHSSRSHSILTISLASEVHDPDDPNTFIRRQGKLSLVDLAGSEKTKKTRSRGNTFVEANNINKSLLVLGNCISCLADSKRRTGHIPYRDSTLTKLLADSLGGTGMALIIACVSPSASNAHETINTLRYASRAKKVKTKPMIRMTSDVTASEGDEPPSLVKSADEDVHLRTETRCPSKAAAVASSQPEAHEHPKRLA